jgi:TRAP-type C4-dicarboxylate transport system substrate-binding protein
MVKSGAAQIHIASPQYPAKYLPELQVITLPYLFGSPEAFDRALDGPVGAEMSRLLEEKTEFKILAFEEFGLKNVFNRRRPVNTLEDL